MLLLLVIGFQQKSLDGLWAISTVFFWIVLTLKAPYFKSFSNTRSMPIWQGIVVIHSGLTCRSNSWQRCEISSFCSTAVFNSLTAFFNWNQEEKTLQSSSINESMNIVQRLKTCAHLLITNVFHLKVNKKIFLCTTSIQLLYLSYYNSANLCLSVCPSVRNSISVNFKLDQCVARNPTMCLSYLSLYGCGQIIKLNDFVWYSLRLHLHQCCCRPFRRRWHTLLPYWRATQGWPKRRTFSEMVDNRQTILTLPSVLSAVCIAQNWYLADILLIV